MCVCIRLHDDEGKISRNTVLLTWIILLEGEIFDGGGFEKNKMIIEKQCIMTCLCSMYKK